jgi:hypothetical protein
MAQRTARLGCETKRPIEYILRQYTGKKTIPPGYYVLVAVFHSGKKDKFMGFNREPTGVRLRPAHHKAQQEETHREESGSFLGAIA